MKFCSRCVLPDTRPGIEIQADGVCNACKGHGQKDSRIDWDARRTEFEQLLKDTKALNSKYDCVVPVSGGKDSTYQVVKCLEYGLKVLAVTWKAPGRNALGQANLDNLVSLGVDHIDYTVNPKAERKFTYKALKRTGSTGVPMHFGLYVIPIRVAMAMNIPLVVWGESPMMEYQGAGDSRQNYELDAHFLRSHGILQMADIEDWVDDELSLEELEVYRIPSDEEFKRVKLKSIFIGYFLRWSPQESFRVASEHGFKVREEGPKVGYYNFADIDDDFISIHHYFKWFKFGFTRLFDNLSLEIRNGFMTRAEAIEKIKSYGDQCPHEDIKTLCQFLEIEEKEFWEIAESFRNKDIWFQQDGVWKIKDFLIDDWNWA